MFCFCYLGLVIGDYVFGYVVGFVLCDEIYYGVVIYCVLEGLLGVVVVGYDDVFVISGLVLDEYVDGIEVVLCRNVDFVDMFQVDVLCGLVCFSCMDSVLLWVVVVVVFVDFYVCDLFDVGGQFVGYFQVVVLLVNGLVQCVVELFCIFYWLVGGDGLMVLSGKEVFFEFEFNGVVGFVVGVSYIGFVFVVFSFGIEVDVFSRFVVERVGQQCIFLYFVSLVFGVVGLLVVCVEYGVWLDCVIVVIVVYG